jgi:CheY-like chemotaxis protein
MINSILLIDDDQDDKYFFSKALEEVNEDIKLITAAEGREAFEKLKFTQPDLILLDIIMPGMNGENFLREIKKQPLLSHIPVIIYTSSLSIFDEKEMLNKGAVEVFIKPVNFKDTVNQIERILSLLPAKQSA